MLRAIELLYLHTHCRFSRRHGSILSLLTRHFSVIWISFSEERRKTGVGYRLTAQIGFWISAQSLVDVGLATLLVTDAACVIVLVVELMSAALKVFVSVEASDISELEDPLPVGGPGVLVASALWSEMLEGSR